MAIKINWIYHLIPPLGPDPQADITTPEKEEILLSPIRMPKIKSPSLKWVKTDLAQFDPNTLPPDKVNVEIEIGSSVLFAYGTILRNFINLKVSFLLDFTPCKWNFWNNFQYFFFKNRKISSVKIKNLPI